MPNQTHDTSGKEYARLSELNINDTIELDDGFTCVIPWVKRKVCSDEGGLFFLCEDGHHYLEGQADDGEHCIGVYHVKG